MANPVPSVLATDELLCAVLRAQAPPWPWDEAPAAILQFQQRAHFHGVTPLLNQYINSGHWPAQVRQSLRDQAVKRAMWELRHQAVLSETITQLAAVGIRPILFKGTALAYSVYGNPVLRDRADTDLIVPCDSRAQTHHALMALGYRREIAVSGEFVSYQANYTRDEADGSSHTLDLHWKINNSQVLSRLFSYEELRSDADALSALCTGALAASCVNALALACMHRSTHKQNPYHVDGVAHHTADRLIWLYDIHLLAGELDVAQWDRLVCLARAKGLRTICAESLQRARDCFGTECPDSVLAALALAGAAERPWLYLNASKLRQQWMDFAALGGISNRLRFLREVFFPPAAYMRSKYAPHQSTSLAWLYLHRVAAGVWKSLGTGSRARHVPDAPNRELDECGTCTMKPKLAKFRALPASDRAAFLKAVVLLPFFSLGLRRLGLTKFQAWLARASPGVPTAPAFAELLALGQIVNAAANHGPGRASCLARSLLLGHMLRLRGVTSQLRIGVRLVEGVLQAHAWVEFSGQPINDDPAVRERFQVFEGPLPVRSFSTAP